MHEYVNPLRRKERVEKTAKGGPYPPKEGHGKKDTEDPDQGPETGAHGENAKGATGLAAPW
jgi:hypothetical protein